VARELAGHGNIDELFVRLLGHVLRDRGAGEIT
jgi:hypothetical protein